MSRHASRVGLAVVLVLAGAGRARAQVEAERWTFSGSLRQTLTDNVFLAAPEGPAESISGATLTLAYGRVGRRSSFAALGWLSGSLYHRFDAYDGAQFGLGASGQIGLTRRARLRLGAAFADGLNLEALYASRVGLPQLEVRSGSVTTGFTYELAPDTSADASFDATWIRYRAGRTVDSSGLPADASVPPDVLAPLLPATPEAGLPRAPDESLRALGLLAAEGIETTGFDYQTWRAGLGLTHGFSLRTRGTAGFGYRRTYQQPDVFADGDQLEAQAALQRVLDTTASLSLSYGYQDNRFRLGVRTHSFVAQGDKEFGKKVKVDASIGASYLDGPDDATSGWTLLGGGGVSMRLKRGLVAARYTRTRYQGLISGRNQITDVLYASFGHTFSRRLFFAAYGYYRDARDQLGTGYSYDAVLVGASLGLRIKQRSSAGVSYGFLRFRNRPLPAAERSVVSLFLAYSRTGR